MHDPLFGTNDASFSGYLKVEEGKNNWIEYWVAIRENRILFYSDECSEESGEEPLKIIELSSNTRCEFLQRRNYHFRFKVTVGAQSLYKFKCSSAFHRQQWISQIMQASSKDHVIELNCGTGQLQLNRETSERHTRSLSNDSQLSSDAEGLHETEVDCSGASNDTANPINTPDSETAKPSVKTTNSERRESKGLLRRLSFKATNRLRRNSNSSPRFEFSDVGTPSSPVVSPASLRLPESPAAGESKTFPVSPQTSSNRNLDVNRVFVNAAFVPSPLSSPAVMKKNVESQEINLIDIS